MSYSALATELALGIALGFAEFGELVTKLLKLAAILVAGP